MELLTASVSAEGLKISVLDGDREVGRVFLYVIRNELNSKPFGVGEDFFVDAAYRNSGVGTQLATALIREARSRECYKVLGFSRFSNDGSHRLMERLGFRKCGYEFRMDLT